MLYTVIVVQYLSRDTSDILNFVTRDTAFFIEFKSICADGLKRINLCTFMLINMLFKINMESILEISDSKWKSLLKKDGSISFLMWGKILTIIHKFLPKQTSLTAPHYPSFYLQLWLCDNYIAAVVYRWEYHQVILHSYRCYMMHYISRALVFILWL